MEKALTGSIDKLLELGVSGLVIMGLCFVIWRLWKANESLQARNDALQEKRITEGKETLIAVNANTNAVTTLTQVIGLIRRD